VRLSRFMPDWECRARLAGTGPSVVPDADISLSLYAGAPKQRRVRLVLEVDLGTERQGTLARKLVAYAAERIEESAGLVAVLADAGEGRLASVRRLVEEHWPSWSLVCRQEEWPGALLSRIGLGDEPPHATSPCGKGRPEGARPCAAEETRGQGEGPSQ
jgi:hypothetical protein